jgi:hypothetical protein
MSLFKDLGKKAKDLLGKGYETDGKKTLKLSNTSNGIKYSVEGTTKGNKLTGNVGVSLKRDDGLTIKKLEVSNKGVLTTDVTLDKAVENVQFTLNAILEPLNQQVQNEKTEVGLTYFADKFTANLKVSPLANQSASANVLYNQDNVSVGVSVAAGIGNEENAELDVTAYDFGLGYNHDNSIATLHLTKKLSHAKFSFFRQHSPDLAFAASISTALTPSNEPKAPSLEFGGSWGAYQAKLTAPSASTENATASFSYKQKLNANADLTLSSVVHLDSNEPQNFFGGEFGMSLAFSC